MTKELEIGRIMPETLAELRGESTSTSYELTLVLTGKISVLTFGDKPSDTLIKQLIELTGAYKATLKEVKTTTTEYKGKDPHTIYVGKDDWKYVGLMVDHDYRGGNLHG